MNAFETYQQKSKQTALDWANPDVGSEAERKQTALFLALALNGESGELGEKIKKYVREDDEEYLDEAKSELGDILWYMAQLATLLDEDLGTIAEVNLIKLLDRQERGVITGQGDNR